MYVPEWTLVVLLVPCLIFLAPLISLMAIAAVPLLLLMGIIVTCIVYPPLAVCLPIIIANAYFQKWRKSRPSAKATAT